MNVKIAILGATGNVGSRISAELLSRGHEVTGVARDLSKLPPGVKGAVADLHDQAQLASAVAGHDAVVHSVKFVLSDPEKVIAAVKAAGVPRLLVVGGAARLEVARGVRLIDSPHFAEEYRAEGQGGVDFLDRLKREPQLDWTYLSPQAFFAPGARTGHFRLGTDQLLIDKNGKSHISMEDFAIAMADEIERPQHSRSSFTVGY